MGIPTCRLTKAKARENEAPLMKVDEGWAEALYFAVSYTWGGQPFDHSIRLNGIRVQVTRGCFDVICSFRKIMAQFTIWIDQLSIDQENEKEKSAQIMLMNKIYSSAAIVVIWLDKFMDLTCASSRVLISHGSMEIDSNAKTPAKSTPTAISSIQNDLKRELEATRALITYLANYFTTRMGNVHRTKDRPLLDTHPSTAWDHVLAILNHRYFERRWIIQEISNSQKTTALILDDQLVSLDLLMQCATQVKMIRWGFSEEFEQCIPPNMIGQLQQHSNPNKCLFEIFTVKSKRIAGTGMSLLSLLTQCRQFCTTNPSDRIYALAAMATDENIPAPDYSLSLDVLLVRIARFYTFQGQGHKILEQAGLAYRSLESSAPSWCPTWEGMFPGPLNDGITQEDSGFSASGSTTPAVAVVGNGNFLRVRGAVIDTVRAVSPPAMASELGDINRDAVVFIRASLPEKRLSDTEFEDLVATFNQSRTNSERFLRIRQPKCFSIETLLRLLLVPDARILTVEGARETSKLTSNAVTDLDRGRWFRGRCLCATTQGYLGLVPFGVKTGDLVSVLAGVNVTTILRVNENQRDTFQMVGDSYFLELGRGEAMDLDYHISARDFVLS